MLSVLSLIIEFGDEDVPGQSPYNTSVQPGNVADTN